MEPSTQSSKNKGTKCCWVPVLCNPSPSAVAVTISDYWYHYPEDGWGKRSSPARLPQFYEVGMWLADSLGRKKKRPPGKDKPNQKRLFRKGTSCYHATVVQAQQRGFGTSALLLGLSSRSFIFCSCGGSIIGSYIQHHFGILWIKYSPSHIRYFSHYCARILAKAA